MKWNANIVVVYTVQTAVYVKQNTVKGSLAILPLPYSIDRKMTYRDERYTQSLDAILGLLTLVIFRKQSTPILYCMTADGQVQIYPTYCHRVAQDGSVDRSRVKQLEAVAMPVGSVLGHRRKSQRNV